MLLIRFAGYHIDVACFLKERGVSFIGADGPNDVSPSGPPQGVGLHQLARQPRLRESCRRGETVEPLRVPVHGRPAPVADTAASRCPGRRGRQA
jgi:hypothetical protein